MKWIDAVFAASLSQIPSVCITADALGHVPKMLIKHNPT
jgi:hypothetical protein